jgi:carboxypeptidase T
VSRPLLGDGETNIVLVVNRGVVGVVCAALLIAIAAPAQAVAPSAAPQLRMYVVDGIYTREQRSQLASLGTDIATVETGRVIIVATEAEVRDLALVGYHVTTFVNPTDFPPQDSNYHNYAEMLADMQAVAAAHPDTVRLFSIGNSWEGRVLHGARVSNDATDNLTEPGVLFVGLHHAREHLTVEVVLSLLHLFAESNNRKVRQLVQTRQIYIVPNLNPDGGEYDIATGQYRFWRKSRQPTPQPGVYGTDENRNYSYKWGCCGGSSGNPGSDTYRGPSAFSAPEDARLSEFVIAHKNIKTAISYHSYGNLILYPYGYTYDDVPADMNAIDHQAFVAIANEMQRTTGYHAQQGSDLYITDGDFNDWMYGAERRYAFTIELGGGGFYPGDEIIPGETQRNHAAAIYVAKIANCPTKVVGKGCRRS